MRVHLNGMIVKWELSRGAEATNVMQTLQILVIAILRMSLMEMTSVTSFQMAITACTIASITGIDWMKTTVFSSRLPSSLSVPRLLLNTSLWLARRGPKRNQSLNMVTN
jgi:hypothetical protein